MARSIDPRLLYRMRFIHPEKTLADMSGFTPAVAARLFSLSRRRYRKAISWFEQGLETALAGFLADRELSEAVDRLPFTPGCTVVGLGDSITDDYQSWFEILRRTWDYRYGGGTVNFVNAGISGDTTTEIVARMLGVVTARPSWVICMAGTNDARRHGRGEAEVLVSLDETRRNYASIERTIREVCGAESLWITLPPVVESAIGAHWFLGPMALSWKNEDLALRSSLLASLGFRVVDVRSNFGNPVDPQLLLPDGLHPSLAGQLGIARSVIEALSVRHIE
jgi:acyl-CoA thioesterase I